MRRLSIFFFYDKDGVVRDFVTYYVKALHSISDYVLTVVNGNLNNDDQSKLLDVSDDLYIRENFGFDVWAYKQAIDYLGWEKVTEYDELILCNFTCYGPIFPFTEMFDQMEERNCDFWGVAKHPEQPSYLLPGYRGYINEHIMSYFMVIRNKMLTSNDFRDYWDNIPEINSKTESTALHETVFTKHFENLGYISDAYVDLKKYQGRCNNLSIFLADELLIKDRCPLLKRRAFAFPLYANLLAESAGSNAIDIIDFISNSTDYDCDMIWQDLLETQKMSILCNNMHLNSIIPEYPIAPQTDLCKVVFLVFVNSLGYYELLKPHLSTIPSVCRIVVLCDDDDVFEECSKSNVEVRHIDLDENSSSVASLIECYDVISTAEYCCCVLNTHLIPSRLEQAFEDHVNIMLSNLIGSSQYIANIIDKFVSDKHLGMLRPAKCSFSSYYGQPYNYVYLQKTYYSSVYHQLNLTVPMDDGTLESDLDASFWIRGDILRKICEMLSNENIAYVLSSRTALEFMLPMIVQENGYYTSSISNTRNALLELDNHVFMQHHFLEKLRSVRCGHHRFYDVEQFVLKSARTVSSNRPVDIKTIVNQKMGMRHILLILLRYPKNKLDNIKQRIKKKIKPTMSFGARIATISLEGERVVFYFIAYKGTNNNMYLSVDGRKFFTKKYLSEGQEMLLNYMKDYEKKEALFFELPINELYNQKIELHAYNNRHINVCWSGNFSFNALELRERGLYVRVCEGNIYIQTKDKFCYDVLHSKSYSRRDKMYFRKAMNEKNHKYTLIAENGGAADNSYQFFKYAVSQGENVLYVASENVVTSEKDPELQKRMVIYNSKRHINAALKSKRWIGSFSLRIELLPTNCLHDIHYAMLPAEWDFIPHGMAIGDKMVAILHKYSWENPSRTFASVPLECQAYRDIYEFKNVCSLGAPRMDKWANAELDSNTIMIFFTWRMSLSTRVGYNDEELFKTTDYYITVTDIVHHISQKFPEKKIYYVVHHELIKNKMDKVLREELAEYVTHFVSYYNNTEGANEFNSLFLRAKYLITDFSSAAFDFAYKNNSIPIYYLKDVFIEGHYPLTETFYDNCLGVVAKNNEELIAALKLDMPSKEMKQRKERFFPYKDNKNCERVFNAIFKEPAPESFLPVKNFIYPLNKIQRLGIYFFYDAEGVVDNYVVYYLKKLRDVCSEICVVVNGEVTAESEEKLSSVCNKLILRKNEGFDSWAYKEALESYGYDNLANNYDEIVLNNFTNFGPIFPFEDMFGEMNKRDCDFWGHCRYIDHNSYIEGQRVVDHLMSYFIVFRSSIIKSKYFREYWTTLSFPETYRQAVVCHELRCTRYFESIGFISDSFMPWKKYRYAANSPVYFAYRQMVEDKSPLLKRKAFFNKEDRFEFPQRDKYSVYDVANYIRAQTDYPMEFIAENMERTMIFPDEILCPENEKERIAGGKSVRMIDANNEHYRIANSRFDPEKLYQGIITNIDKKE